MVLETDSGRAASIPVKYAPWRQLSRKLDRVAGGRRPAIYGHAAAIPNSGIALHRG